MSIFTYQSNRILYTKPETFLSPWSNGIIVGAEKLFNAVGTGIYVFTLPDPGIYIIYEQLGASPSGPDTGTPDLVVGSFSARTSILSYASEEVLYFFRGTSEAYLISLARFGSVVTGTPTVRQKIGNEVEGGSYNLTNGVGTDWYLPISIPNGAILGDPIRLRISAVVDGSNVTLDIKSKVGDGVDIELGPRFNTKWIIQDDDANLITGAQVYITTEPSASASIKREGYSNEDAKVEFDLTEGEYYLWRNKRNYSFADPVNFEVSNIGVVTIL